jgi:DNA mismatch repair protein MutS2
MNASLATAQTAHALEFPALLALLAREARTDLGRERLKELQPASQPAELTRRRAAYQAVATLWEESPLIPAFEVPLRPLFARVVSGDPPLTGPELLELALALEAAEAAAVRWLEFGSDPPPLEGNPQALEALQAPLRRLRQVLDSRGEVRPEASPRLEQLGRELRSHRDRIYRRLRELREAHPQLEAEEEPPLADGRLVLRLQHPDRRAVPGIVHGRSGSGRSVYFEPLEVVEDNNALARARLAYEQEAERILSELRQAFRAQASALAEARQLLAELDMLEALHGFALATQGGLAELAPDGILRLRRARHPLLDPALAAAREAAFGQPGHTGEVVPLDLDLHPQQRLLVLTGPNAGGKTVALKTVGLLALLHACGSPIPAEPGTAIPWFERLVAVVGDDQDLLEERSTFSGRLLRLREAWNAAGPRSLVLLDELGSGTDPLEGGALSQALLEELAQRGTLGILTTHLPQLAAAALELPGVVPARMEFEPQKGVPTFRLQVGLPGGSEALALARRLGLEERWISRAEALLGSGYLELVGLLQRLAAEQQALLEARGEAERVRAEAEAARARFELEENRLKREQKELARKLRTDVEEFLTRVERELASERERLRQELRRGRGQKALEEARARLFRDRPELPSDSLPTEQALDPKPGALVRHRRHGWEGTVQARLGDRVVLAVRGKRVELPLEELEPGSGGKSREVAHASEPEVAKESCSTELHLRGQRVEEALVELDGFLDQALRQGHEKVRIIHGHGTGRLRAAVREHLRHHPLVDSYRPGEPREGGNGATVVELLGAPRQERGR